MSEEEQDIKRKIIELYGDIFIDDRHFELNDEIIFIDPTTKQPRIVNGH